jgi:Domain of unknown function (DUF4252)
MRKTIIAIAIPVLLLLAASAGQAQNLTALPGYVPLEKLDLFPQEKLSVEINIEGAFLNLVAAGTKTSEPEFSSLIAGLKSIKVQAVPLKGLDVSAVRTRIGNTVRWLEDRGWKSTLKVRDEGEETYIYLKEVDGKIAGLTLLSLSPGDEAVVINIVGRIDPAQIGRLAQHFDVDVKLKQEPPPAASNKKPEKPEKPE